MNVETQNRRYCEGTTEPRKRQCVCVSRRRAAGISSPWNHNSLTPSAAFGWTWGVRKCTHNQLKQVTKAADATFQCYGRQPAARRPSWKLPAPWLCFRTRKLAWWNQEIFITGWYDLESLASSWKVESIVSVKKFPNRKLRHYILVNSINETSITFLRGLSEWHMLRVL